MARLIRIASSLTTRSRSELARSICCRSVSDPPPPRRASARSTAVRASGQRACCWSIATSLRSTCTACARFNAHHSHPDTNPAKYDQKQNCGDDCDGRRWMTTHPFHDSFDPPGRPRQDRLIPQKATEIIGQIRRRRIPLLRRLLQAFQANVFQIARHPGIEPRGRHRILGNDLPLGFRGGFSPERGTAGQHFVKNRAQRIDVDGAANRIGRCAGLFGRHVAGRSHALRQ